MKSLAVCAFLLSAAAFAATDRRVAQGISLYDQGEFAPARDALVTVVGSPTLSREDRIQARSYLAAAYHALGDVASAKAQLLMLAREHPDARLDAGIFLPELIALADEARIDVAQEPKPPEPARPEPIDDPPRPIVRDAPVVTPAPVEVVRAPLPDPRPSLGLMFVPFGVAQFALDQEVKGTLFLTGEVVAFGTSAVALAMFESNKISGPFLGGGTFRDVQKAQTLQTIHLVAGYTGLALIVGGVIDALISRADLPAGSAGGIRPQGDGHGMAEPAYSMTGQGLLIRF